MGTTHILQSPHWAAFKSEFGWQTKAISLPKSTHPTQILFRKLPFGLKIAYVPKGPQLNWQNTTIAKAGLQKLVQVAQQPGVFVLKIEPDVAPSSQTAELLAENGFRPARTIQPAATILVDISAPEDEILARMKSKTRYNIRLAGRKGVSVREGTAADLPTFYRLSQITAERDGFGVHSPEYYRAVYNQFPLENRALLVAEFEGEPLRADGFCVGRRGILPLRCIKRCTPQ